MDALTELINLTQIDPSANAKKDRKQNNPYRNAQVKSYNKATGEQINKRDSAEINWDKADRRSGEDRREKQAEKLGKFEYRNNKDRRKNKQLSLTA